MEYARPTHSRVVGYLVWLLGFTGAHRFYYGRPISGTIYFRDGLRQLRASEHAYPEQPPPPDEKEM